MPQTPNGFIEREILERDEADAHRANELREKGLATFEFRAFVTVLATDEHTAEQLASDALEDVAASHPTNVRASLDDGPPDYLDPEDF